MLAGALHEPVQPGTDPASLTARADHADQVAVALAALSGAGIGVAELALGQPTLDEVFMALTGRPAEEVEEIEAEEQAA